MTAKRGLIYFAFLLLFFPISSYAYVLDYQSDSSTTSAGGFIYTQSIASSTSGTLSSITLYLSDLNTIENLRVCLFRATTTPSGGCSSSLPDKTFMAETTSNLVTATKGAYTFTFASPPELVAVSQYWFKIYPTDNTLDTSFDSYGTTLGSFYRCFINNPPSTDCNSSVKNLYYVLNSDSESAVSGQFVFSTPTHNQIFPTATVPIYFTYYNNSVLNYYDRIGIAITNITDSQQLLPMETSIIGSGSQVFSTTTVLSANKNYSVYAYMRSSTASSTTITSNVRMFTTVSSPYPMSVLPATQVISSDVASTSGFATTSVASSTIAFLNLDAVLPTNISEKIKTRFPFSYLYDAFALLGELANGTAYSSASYTLPLGAVFTNAQTGSTSTSIIVLDRSAILQTGYTDGIRSLISMSLYFVTALFSIGMIMSVL